MDHEERWQQSENEPGDLPNGAASIASLLARMRRGDREAAATFLLRYESRIRRRVRGKLGGSMRRLFDSLDIISTLGRRLDDFVRSGRVEAVNEAQLWSLVQRIADNAVIDKARVYRRLDRVEGEDSPFARALLARLEAAERAVGTEEAVPLEIESAVSHLPDRVDRRILLLWLDGLTHEEIGLEVDLTGPAVRKRWQKIRAVLRDRFEDEPR